MYFGNRFSGTDKSLHQKDFVKAAEADGFPFAARLADKAKVPEALAEFVRYPGPAFLEVLIDQDACVYPMVGPGMGYRDMITGEFIHSRQTTSQEPSPDVDMTKVPDLF